MNIGYWSCMILVPCFFIMGLVFALFKEKAAQYISGFNTLSKEEQAKYDKEHMVKDMRNACFLWTVIMLMGATLSYYLTPYMAVLAYMVWGYFFFKDVCLDTDRAFKKYLLNNNK